ncbi:DUF3293 domain-containing protein [Commensalibacter nepenthis]|uniref:DUF3293 domain-containing protein n=1 Tax=Commensalibacter nepenthis TaxID=3043872 RepID=A0ABT6Q5W3_9PROT|nr:DUF3293 domain-containing protein [Commensalibacter sp. TBRC 10068]MDI2112294.1 DUF3293 domain-containing protein [Commensalibacter sp. TBRC 10068]
MPNILPPTPAVNVAYKQSLYQAGSVMTRIDQYPEGIPHKLHKSTLIMLSAYNPGGRLRPLGWNIKMMRRLEQEIKQYEYFMGKGSLKEVSEPLFMVVISLSKALVLARKFRQNAIVLIRYQRLSKLIFLA